MTPLFGFIGMFLGWTMSLLSIFLILLVLVQRGRGGGLTGALGGPGGQSAFGSKAGDMFTKITSVAALLWIGLCALATASLGEKPLPADDFADEDVPGLLSRDPSDETPLSFPSPTDAENPLDEDQMKALDGALNEAITDAAAEADAAEDGAAEADATEEGN